MILVDTSVWVDHIRAADARLSRLLLSKKVLTHPFVIGEIALGHLRNRGLILTEIGKLAQVTVATDAEVLQFVELRKLAGQGIGYVDAHLLVSVALTAGSSLWTRDKRLHAAAVRLRLNAVV